jgi:hypothetical protein
MHLLVFMNISHYIEASITTMCGKLQPHLQRPHSGPLWRIHHLQQVGQRILAVNWSIVQGTLVVNLPIRWDTYWPTRGSQLLTFFIDWSGSARAQIYPPPRWSMWPSSVFSAVDYYRVVQKCPNLSHSGFQCCRLLQGGPKMPQPVA